ncbi:fibroblast growth factor-binding protein 2 [Ambystoma mexicanum]|uniref:fibroblast growth factor-binding protein 2 n=1 Tax=Ambystoma mexicanum TaxID=8296 RepID=UPI0037E961E7
MRAAAFLVLLALCCLGAEGQKPKPKKRSHAEEKIVFQTKGKDSCTMATSGHGEIKLRVDCKSQGKAYWCEYTGKPSFCRNFNNNPKLYWTQISLELKKVTNACEPKAMKPSMCPKAPADAEMKQVATSSGATLQAKPAPKAPAVAPKQIKEAQPVPGKGKKPAKPKPTTASPGKPTESASEDKAMKLAQEHCWESLHGFCSYLIGFFAR